MSAQIISGKDISAAIRDELQARVQDLKERHGTTPGLATVLAGASPAAPVDVGVMNKTAVPPRRRLVYAPALWPRPPGQARGVPGPLQHRGPDPGQPAPAQGAGREC